MVFPCLGASLIIDWVDGSIARRLNVKELLPWFDGGSLANAVGLEAFAAVLLTINLRHKGKASLRLVGVEPRPPTAP